MADPSENAPSTRVCVAACLAVGTVVWAGSFAGRFVFDDYSSIVDNPAIRQIWPPGPVLAQSVRPVAYLTFAANYALHGTQLLGYHAVNLAIHLAAALVLLGIVRRTLAGPRLGDRYGKAAGWLALAAALFWMVHPLQTESVTYVVQRIESLMGLLFLLTLYLFLRGAESDRPIGWYVGAVVACALGMATKEVMAAAPLLVLWYDRAFVGISWREVLRSRGKVHAALAGTWAVLAGLMLAQRSSYETSALVGGSASPLRYVSAQPGVILHYLRLTFWPAGQCLDYGWTLPSTPVELLLPALALGTLAVLTVWAAWRRPAWGFLGGWFFLILGPTSSIVPIRDLAFEHRMYLPLAAVVVATVMGVYELSRRSWFGVRVPSGVRGTAMAVAVAVAVGLLGLATAQRNRVYRSELAMWSDVVEKAPQNPRGHYNLALAFSRRGQTDEAIQHYGEALRLRPRYPNALNNLGVLLAARDQWDEAARLYRRAVDACPELANAQMNLADALARQGRLEEAAMHLRQALDLKPALAEYARSQPHLARLLGHVSPAVRDRSS